jgi:hypothetical protein
MVELAHHMLEHIPGSGMRPLQVLEHEDDRTGRRNKPQTRDDLAEEGVFLRTGVVPRVVQRGDQTRDRSLVLLAHDTELLECFCPRCVARLRVRLAAPARHQLSRTQPYFARESADQRRFANARLAHDECQVWSTLDR